MTLAYFFKAFAPKKGKTGYHFPHVNFYHFFALTVRLRIEDSPQLAAWSFKWKKYYWGNLEKWIKCFAAADIYV